MQSYNPAIPGCTFSRLLNGRYARKQQNAEKPRVLAINALQPAYLLLLLQPSGLWLSLVTFNKATAKAAERITRSGRLGYPPCRVTPPIM